jgi:hypothetical protein
LDGILSLKRFRVFVRRPTGTGGAQNIVQRSKKAL